MSEDYGLCTQYKYHKHNLIFILSAMRSYRDELSDSYMVEYSEIDKNNKDKSSEQELGNAIKKYRIQENVSYDIENRFFSIIKTILNSQNNQHLHTDDWHRTVYIDTIDVHTTDFNVSEEKKKKLIEQGVKSTHKYFEWYDKSDPKDIPINHPNCNV